jgi:hypothetical protein
VGRDETVARLLKLSPARMDLAVQESLLQQAWDAGARESACRIAHTLTKVQEWTAKFPLRGQASDEDKAAADELYLEVTNLLNESKAVDRSADRRERPIQTARQWLIDGGGGFEDGEDGIRACTMPAEHAIELMDEYAAHVARAEAGVVEAPEVSVNEERYICRLCRASVAVSYCLQHDRENHGDRIARLESLLLKVVQIQLGHIGGLDKGGNVRNYQNEALVEIERELSRGAPHAPSMCPACGSIDPAIRNKTGRTPTSWDQVTEPVCWHSWHSTTPPQAPAEEER